ncbi:MAG: helicase-related protein, partial [Anaerolineae bacterium]
VIVDESHNFRNPNAKRYQNLSKLLSMGKNKKLVLLTATPINTGVFDLYQQMRLITGGRDDFFAGVGISSLRSYFVQAETNREALHDLLEAVAVRRSREFIRRNYPEAEIDGQRIRFPERQLHTVRYNLEETYEGLYDEASAAIEHLNLAPYLLDFYRKGLLEQQRMALKAGNFSGVPQDLAMILGRQTALVSILKMLYLKRLESSVVAFKISIERQMRFQKKFLEQLKAGRLLSSRAFHRIESIKSSWQQLEDDDSLTEGERQETEEKADQAIAELLDQLEPVNPADYDIASIQSAIEQDIQALQAIYDKLAPAGPREDDKFLALQQLLTGELKGKKVVVFTYFKDTARYLYRNLRNDDNFITTWGYGQLSITDSGIKSEELRDRIIRFAPQAHDRPDLKGSGREIQLLISTDVLSEGQNLQDADTVVNYDLHWNPIRMIQRIGRLDRLGSPHTTVHTYNFVPEDALESLIGLMKRLRDRLEAINRAGLLDAPVLGEVPTPQDFNALRRIAQGDESIWQELESLSELDIGEFLKQEVLDFLKRVGEEKLKQLPPGVGSGKRAPDGHRGLFVHLKGGNQHWWLFYDLATKHFLERKLEVIKLVRCNEHEALVPPDFDIYPIIELAKRHVVSRLRQAHVKLPRLRPPQNHILNWLKTQRADDAIQ